jgi:hypothetical protein
MTAEAQGTEGSRGAVRGRPRGRRWVAFFIVLGLLGSAAVIVPMVYNLRLQLRPEQLAEARRLWAANGPRDYNLDYLVKTEHAGTVEEDEYMVRVRGGRVVLVASNGEVIYLAPALAGTVGPAAAFLSRGHPSRYGVPALFDEMEAMLRRDEAAGSRNYATAAFDPHDGHPVRYVHRVRGTHDRIEWTLKLSLPKRHPDQDSNPERAR